MALSVCSWSIRIFSEVRSRGGALGGQSGGGGFSERQTDRQTQQLAKDQETQKSIIDADESRGKKIRVGERLRIEGLTPAEVKTRNGA